MSQQSGDACRALGGGVAVSELDLRWLRSNVGAVSQDPAIFAGTVSENIAYARPGAAHSEVEVGPAESCPPRHRRSLSRV